MSSIGADEFCVPNSGSLPGKTQDFRDIVRARGAPLQQLCMVSLQACAEVLWQCLQKLIPCGCLDVIRPACVRYGPPLGLRCKWHPIRVDSQYCDVAPDRIWLCSSACLTAFAAAQTQSRPDTSCWSKERILSRGRANISGNSSIHSCPSCR